MSKSEELLNYYQIQGFIGMANFLKSKGLLGELSSVQVALLAQEFAAELRSSMDASEMSRMFSELGINLKADTEN